MTAEGNDSGPHGHAGLSRRTVLKGAGSAWAASAITLSTAVPAIAASGPAHFTATAGPKPAKSNPYKQSVTFNNTGGAGVATVVLSLVPAEKFSVSAAGWTADNANKVTSHVLVSNATLPSGSTIVTFTITRAKSGGGPTLPNLVAVVSPA